MKRIESFRFFYILIIGFVFSSITLRAGNADLISHLKFKQITTFNGLPTDEVQKIYQDKEGFIWLATRYGLAMYDGYRVTCL